ncbi:MAG TPA: hypothetical protein VG498_12085 [Terriglobales bacterium]|nr:hypothetical protein [Terriglobales bacterium]
MPARLKLVDSQLNFETIDSLDVPHDRKGKHNALISRIMRDLQIVAPGVALKVPVSALRSQKIENIRAALSREVKKTRLKIATSIDNDYFYVWRKKP